MTKKQIKKLHHFLPRFYLKNFTDGDGALEIFLLKENRRVKSSVAVAGAEKFLYSVTLGNNPKDDSVENMFAEFERKMAPAVNKLTDPRSSLSDEDKEWIVHFISFQFLRTPKSLDHLESISKGFTEREIERLANDDERLRKAYDAVGITDKTFEEMKEFMQKGRKELKLKMDRNHLIGHAISLHEEVFPILYYLNWKILVAPKGSSFLTSDFPFSTVVKTGTGEAIMTGGFGNTKTEVSFPISPRIFLTANREGEIFFKRVKIGSKLVNRLNFRTIGCAKRFLYAQKFTPDHLLQIEKFQNSESK